MADKKTICLNMIVKNEAHILRHTLENLLSYIPFDYWVISDTGSTDNTKALIQEFFDSKRIPGMLTEVPWQNFGYNRTVALEQAYNKTDYVLIWDADDEICGDFVLPSPLTEDSYNFQFGSENGYCLMRPQLFNNRKRWNYVGVLHEYSECLEPSKPAYSVRGSYYFTLGHGGSRNKDPEKYVKDAAILEEAFQKALEEKNSISNRYAFYCANSYRCGGNKEKAIEWYQKVLTLNNWSEEKYVSCFRIYDLMSGNKEAALHYLVKAYKFNPKRIEAIFRLVHFYCLEGMSDVSYMYYTLIQKYYEDSFFLYGITDNFLTVDITEYTFFLPYYMIIVSDRTKHHNTGLKMFRIIFKYKYLQMSQWWVDCLFHNMQFYCNRVRDPVFFKELWDYVSALRKAGRNVQEPILEQCRQKEASLVDMVGESFILSHV